MGRDVCPTAAQLLSRRKVQRLLVSSIPFRSIFFCVKKFGMVYLFWFTEISLSDSDFYSIIGFGDASQCENIFLESSEKLFPKAAFRSLEKFNPVACKIII